MTVLDHPDSKASKTAFGQQIVMKVRMYTFIKYNYFLLNESFVSDV